MNKSELLSKMSELLDAGYTFIALDDKLDEVCQNKAIVSALRSQSLPVYYDPNCLNKGNLNLAHTNTTRISDNSERISPNLVVVKSLDAQLILTNSDKNSMVSACQDYVDFTNQTGIVLKSAGFWRQERGNSELIGRINRQSK